MDCGLPPPPLSDFLGLKLSGQLSAEDGDGERGEYVNLPDVFSLREPLKLGLALPLAAVATAEGSSQALYFCGICDRSGPLDPPSSTHRANVISEKR